MFYGIILSLFQNYFSSFMPFSASMIYTSCVPATVAINSLSGSVAVNFNLLSFYCCQITFSLGCLLAMTACFWFYVQDIRGRNVVYATAIIMGCGGSVMLVTSLSLIAELIGHDKVMIR